MHLPISRLKLGKIESRNARSVRPANLIDYAVGIVAIAIGLKLMETVSNNNQFNLTITMYNDNYKEYYIRLVLVRSLGLLVPLTIGYLLLRLRGRRPPSPRMSRHPGFVAATVATATMMLCAALSLAKLLAGFRTRSEWTPWVIDFYPSVGYAVLGSWPALMFTGRWRRDRLWFEVPGILLGFAWIATALVEWTGLVLGLQILHG